MVSFLASPQSTSSILSLLLLLLFLHHDSVVSLPSRLPRPHDAPQAAWSIPQDTIEISLVSLTKVSPRHFVADADGVWINSDEGPSQKQTFRWDPSTHLVYTNNPRYGPDPFTLYVDGSGRWATTTERDVNRLPPGSTNQFKLEASTDPAVTALDGGGQTIRPYVPWNAALATGDFVCLDAKTGKQNLYSSFSTPYNACGVMDLAAQNVRSLPRVDTSYNWEFLR